MGTDPASLRHEPGRDDASRPFRTASGALPLGTGAGRGERPMSTADGGRRCVHFGIGCLTREPSAPASHFVTVPGPQSGW